MTYIFLIFIIKIILARIFLILFHILWGGIWIMGTSAPALWSIFEFDLNYWGMLIWPMNLLLFSFLMIFFSRRYFFSINKKIKNWANLNKEVQKG